MITHRLFRKIMTYYGFNYFRNEACELNVYRKVCRISLIMVFYFYFYDL